MRSTVIRRTQASPTAYVVLVVVLLASAFPLSWSFVIGSKDSAALVQDPYSFVLFIVRSKLGWIGSLWAVIIPSSVSAFGVFWMTQYLQKALPDELIGASRVDGASSLRTFWSIAPPGAAVLGLFTFIATWTNFFWPFIILDPGNPTLPVALQQLQRPTSSTTRSCWAGSCSWPSLSSCCSPSPASSSCPASCREQ